MGAEGLTTVRSDAHQQALAERGGVQARLLGADRISEAVALLDRAEHEAGGPLVDESERHRLQALAVGDGSGSDHHHAVLARRDDEAVGYGALLLPDEDDDAREARAVGDVALDRSRPPCDDTLLVLLRALERVAGEHEVARMQVWIRHADPADVVCAADAGYGVERRLGVLGRSLAHLHRHPWSPEDGTDDPLPGGWRLRSYRAEEDDAAVVEALRAAYEGTADAGWTLDAFRARTDYDWFEPADLLLVEDTQARIGGLHWTKRRDATTGEVYNLAVAPHAQGEGLGAALLHAGLHHLRDVGCDQVLLWVDLANETAVRLYVAQGFRTRWEDIALARTLR